MSLPSKKTFKIDPTQIKPWPDFCVLKKQMNSEPMTQLNERQWRHLHLRAGFGPGVPETFKRKTSVSDAVDRIFQRAKRARQITLISPPSTDAPRLRDLPPEARKQLRKQRRQDLVRLNHHWLQQMATDSAQLREKMTLFWHGHFACAIKHPLAMQNLNNTMRQHALGNFGALLTAVSKHPAMLEYLNNKQNRKGHPNENFARELMELFTLGRGHYTEKDIQEAARAFTGWNYNQVGQFVFRHRQHDFGRKTFRGKTGEFGGEDILRMLLADKQTARYLSEKLYCFFVHPEPSAKAVEELATVLYDRNYDIAATLRHLFTAPWFYDAANLAAHIKSPVEFLVTMMRQLSMKLPEAKPVTNVQRVLGQVLFQPPNVAGWPGGQAWIDSSTLLLRMTLPRALILADDPDFEIPGELMDMGTRGNSLRKVRKIKAEFDWSRVAAAYRGIPDDELPEMVVRRLLNVDPARLNLALIDRYTDKSSRGARLKTLHLQVLSLPEYQLA